jgi:hypothetical protein
MSVDYRLLDHFDASRERLARARAALPAHWRTDPRPEAQIMNDHWEGVIAQAAEPHEHGGARSPRTALIASLEHHDSLREP